jgi:hypothetical protein
MPWRRILNAPTARPVFNIHPAAVLWLDSAEPIALPPNASALCQSGSPRGSRGLSMPQIGPPTRCGTAATTLPPARDYGSRIRFSASGDNSTGPKQANGQEGFCRPGCILGWYAPEGHIRRFGAQQLVLCDSVGPEPCPLENSMIESGLPAGCRLRPRPGWSIWCL